VLINGENNIKHDTITTDSNSMLSPIS